MTLKIFSWNACLGVFNKLNYVTSTIMNDSPDVFFIQEAEINHDLENSLIQIQNYDLIRSENFPKSRLICYVKNSLKFSFQTFNGIELILVKTKNYDIFGLYCPFKLSETINRLDYLKSMIEAIKTHKRASKKLAIIGDLNLDFLNKDNPLYPQSRLYNEWSNLIDTENLIQLVKKHTWTRIVNNNIKESILDHVYEPSSPEPGRVQLIDTNFSDHKLLSYVTEFRSENFKQKNCRTLIRSWKNYSKESLNAKLSEIDWPSLT